MRSNSGKDEARNNLHDPTLRDHERDRKKHQQALLGKGRSTEMGSNARKSGEEGDEPKR